MLGSFSKSGEINHHCSRCYLSRISEISLIPKISQKEGEEVYHEHLVNQQQIQIQIVFGFLKMTKYEYYSVLKKHPNTNTNTNSCLKCQPNIKIWII